MKKQFFRKKIRKASHINATTRIHGSNPDRNDRTLTLITGLSENETFPKVLNTVFN
jgi:predicted NodU family carbamoyl transferase